MSKPANKTIIGIFVVGAIALAVVAVVVLGSGKFFKKTFKAVCYFEGSVGGLNIGAPVIFRGVKIGSVADVVLRFDTTKLSFTIPVYIEIDPSKIESAGPIPKKLGENLKTFIDRGLRASLETQSIVTGQKQVALNFYPGKPVKVAEDKIDTKTPEIPTIQTPMEEFVNKIEKLPIDEIFEKLRSTLAEIEKVVKSPEIPETIRSAHLALEDVQKLVRDLNEQVGPLASNLNNTVKDVQKLVQNTDTKVGALTSNLDETVKDVRKFVQNADVKVTRLASSLNETVKDVRGLVKDADNKIGPLTAGIEGTLKSVDVTLTVAQKTLEHISGTFKEDSPTVYLLNKTLQEVNSLARSFRVLADYLERHPESLIRGK